jgi:hypothetical protein
MAKVHESARDPGDLGKLQVERRQHVTAEVDRAGPEEPGQDSLSPSQ